MAKTPNPGFVLNRPEYGGASVLIAGNNFGCGSSREHAPWALLGAGFKAVISTDFADIFRNNSLKNGLLPIIVDEETQQQLFSLAEEDPSTSVSVDVEAQTLDAAGRTRRSDFRWMDSPSTACSTAWTSWAICWRLTMKFALTSRDNPQRVVTTA